jgi:hypothetical protein
LEGTISLGGGHLAKRGAGVAELVGPARHVGVANVEEGALRLVGDGELAGEFQVASGGMLEIVGNQSFSEMASLVGDGEVVGDVVMGGMLAAGPTFGELTLTGSLELGSTSRAAFEIGGLAVGVEHDHVAIAGSAALGGTLEVTFADAFSPALGDAFELIAASEILGVFDAVELPELTAEFVWDIGYSQNAVVVSIAQNLPPVPADFNRDGVVDGADLQEWSSQFGMISEAPPLLGDANGSLTVDGNDFLIWQTSHSSAPAIAASVPEPAGFALSILGLWGLCLASLCSRDS